MDLVDGARLRSIGLDCFGHRPLVDVGDHGLDALFGEAPDEIHADLADPLHCHFLAGQILARPQPTGYGMHRSHDPARRRW